MLCSGRHFCTLHVAMGDGCYVDSLINTSFSWCAVFAHLSGVFSPPYRRCKFEWLNRLWNFCLYTKNQNKMSDSDISSHREQRSINGPTSILFSVDVDMSHIYFIMQVFPWLIPPQNGSFIYENLSGRRHCHISNSMTLFQYFQDYANADLWSSLVTFRSFLTQSIDHHQTITIHNWKEALDSNCFTENLQYPTSIKKTLSWAKKLVIKSNELSLFSYYI